MVTRRQFGVWTTSALILGPTAARAGGTEQQQQVVEAPTGLEAIAIEPSINRMLEGGELIVDLKATNHAKSGQTVIFDVVELILSDGKETVTPLAWMNDNHPFSRRIKAPSFVDLPADKATFCGKITTTIPPEWLKKSGRTAQLKLYIADGNGKTREVTLDPLALDGQEDNS